jgi:D-alanine-D-alanine ligase
VKWEEETRPTRLPSRSSPTISPRRSPRSSTRPPSRRSAALQLRDYGRIDFRLAQDGTVHVLEVNPNPYLLPTAEFSMAAKKSGRSYVETIGEIADLAMARYAAES